MKKVLQTVYAINEYSDYFDSEEEAKDAILELYRKAKKCKVDSTDYENAVDELSDSLDDDSDYLDELIKDNKPIEFELWKYESYYFYPNVDDVLELMSDESEETLGEYSEGYCSQLANISKKKRSSIQKEINNLFDNYDIFKYSYGFDGVHSNSYKLQNNKLEVC